MEVHDIHLSLAVGPLPKRAGGEAHGARESLDSVGGARPPRLPTAFGLMALITAPASSTPTTIVDAPTAEPVDAADESWPAPEPCEALRLLRLGQQVGDADAVLDERALRRPLGNTTFGERAEALHWLSLQGKDNRLTRQQARDNYELVAKFTRPHDDVMQRARLFRTLEKDFYPQLGCNPGDAGLADQRAAFTHLCENVPDDAIRQALFVKAETRPVYLGTYLARVAQTPFRGESVDERLTVLSEVVTRWQKRLPAERWLPVEKALSDYRAVLTSAAPAESFAQVTSDYLAVLRNEAHLPSDAPMSAFTFLRAQTAADKVGTREILSRGGDEAEVREASRFLTTLPGGEAQRQAFRQLVARRSRVSDAEKLCQTLKRCCSDDEFVAGAQWMLDIMSDHPDDTPTEWVDKSFQYMWKTRGHDAQELDVFRYLTQESRLWTAIGSFDHVREPIGDSTARQNAEQLLRIVALGTEEKPEELFPKIRADVSNHAELVGWVDRYVLVAKVLDNRPAFPAEIARVLDDQRKRPQDSPEDFSLLMRLTHALGGLVHWAEGLRKSMDTAIDGESVEVREQAFHKLREARAGQTYQADEANRSYPLLLTQHVTGEPLDETVGRLTACLRSIDDVAEAHKAFARASHLRREEGSASVFIGLVEKLHSFPLADQAHDLLTQPLSGTTLEDRSAVFGQLLARRGTEAVADLTMLCAHEVADQKLEDGARHLIGLGTVLRDPQQARDAYTYVAQGVAAGAFGGRGGSEVFEQLQAALLLTSSLDDAKAAVDKAFAAPPDGAATIQRDSHRLQIGNLQIPVRRS